MMRMLPECGDIEEINRIRRFETEDIAKRLGYIKASDIKMINYPENPIKIFNPSFLVFGNVFRLYPRLVFGYYKYSNAIGRIDLELNDILAGLNAKKKLECELTLYPSNLMDFFGLEDPRAQLVNKTPYIIYTGRTRWFFDKKRPKGKLKTTSLIAKSVDGITWEKKNYIILDDPIMNDLSFIKNSVLLPIENRIYLLSRIQAGDSFYAAIYGILKDNLKQKTTFCPIPSESNKVFIKEASFEHKIGWGTPPIKISNNEYLLFLHGVCNNLLIYRVFAILVRVEKDLKITAITPKYIMQPKEMYEIYGERPYVVFPCGASKIDDQVIISYGAADSFVGIASFDLTELLQILDKNRVC